MARRVSIDALAHGFAGRFHAMGGPCEVLSEATSATAKELSVLVANETWRIEEKFSRYRKGNIVDRINTALGQPVEVDEETADLLDFADTLYSLSDGMFDITSGVLRQAWTFDGSNRIPAPRRVTELMPLIGWDKVAWRSPLLQLRAGMEIDLGGIGKEYAVDRGVMLLRRASKTPSLVNLGGDLSVTGPPGERPAWSVGIEARQVSVAEKLLELKCGALATSGDARRFLEKDGVRYSHVLNPKTGWPVADAATSITVAADTCVQAGMLSTLAILKGAGAEDFLTEQAEQYWCRRRPLSNK